MNILHYFLGFPPYRSGGLTRYAFDLMTAQAESGDRVCALWPGQMELLGKKVKIRKGRKIAGVQSFELVNPLPVALDEGVADPDAYMTACVGDGYERFLQKLQPDVIHVHTLMGLHKEFLDAAQKRGVRTVFTTHDYYGICPKVTLYRNGQVCGGEDCKGCAACNQSGLSMKKILIMQSPLYRLAKNTPLVAALRKRHRGAFFAEESLPELPEDSALAEKYRQLRKYYTDMLEMMDLIHFNSSMTEDVYRRYVQPKDSRVVSITHKNVKDNRSLAHIPGHKLRITCLAPAKPFKGYTVLKTALDALWNEGKRDFVLKLFGPVPETAPYMQVKEDGFLHSQLPEILANTDVLVAPSVWYETFGFTVLEALSYGVPVIVTDHVGAKDMVGQGGIVIPAADAKALQAAIESLTPDTLERMRRAVANDVQIKTWDAFLEENRQLYQPAQ